jgi:NADH pyrophosphatase NudC (nudix superfamily)
MPSSKPLFIKGFSKRFNVNRIDDLPKTLVLLGEHMQTRETFIAVDVQKSKFELLPDEKAVDLRFVMSNLDDETAAILCHSKGMIGWHLNHQFCSKCGHGPTQILEGGMKRKCSSW